MRVIAVVLFCHFLAAFTALGMPLFLPRMMVSLGGSESDYLIGLMFIVPTLCTAFSAPWWGRFADKYGKKTSLLRAQLGLGLGFLLSGFADSVPMFALGLMVQGVCGGTMAASNAYLSRFYQGKALASNLNLTQSSARLALVSAPIILGIFSQVDDPLTLYRVLALLPLIAFGICLFLPSDIAEPCAQSGAVAPKSASVSQIATTGFSQVLWLQFFFCFSMVVTFPYFLPYSEHLGVNSDALSGFYYSLPHLIYLLLSFNIKSLSMPAKLQSQIGFSLLCLACLGQFLLVNSLGLLIFRVLFGFGMLLVFNGLHLIVSHQIQQCDAGLTFGRFDAWGKWAGVAAGIGASSATQVSGLNFPFLLAALSCGCALVGLVLFYKEVEQNVDPIKE
ncbi:Transporter, putative [Shewanella piezotolerans WP3]|uniref:Transporter, putative n=1 Tax=Shewanella piezotolerans (strain WP3 / JCM 13877) TaxID=225849 RepID=B8CGT9_SHEPW|nr:MFS transporter [Shewanella piezotolerans]ACJ26932.1 Transporter, putative [Shewanella piezotolerans WP3]